MVVDGDWAGVDGGRSCVRLMFRECVLSVHIAASLMPSQLWEWRRDLEREARAAGTDLLDRARAASKRFGRVIDVALVPLRSIA